MEGQRLRIRQRWRGRKGVTEPEDSRKTNAERTTMVGQRPPKRRRAEAERRQRLRVAKDGIREMFLGGQALLKEGQTKAKKT